MATLEVRDLHVSVDGTEILKGVNLVINPGRVSALMGPNGAGKSTLGYALMGHPKYVVTKGSMRLDGQDISAMPVHRRAISGLFLSFQYPSEVAGVSIPNFLRTSLSAIEGRDVPAVQFLKILREKMALLGIPQSMVKRHLNEGFSGGEKKKMEILQMAVLHPRIAILDETDSGLDIDALRSVAEGINQLRGPDLGILLITHYQRILGYVKPDIVHVMMGGKIVRSGGHELAEEIEKNGYGTKDTVIKESN